MALMTLINCTKDVDWLLRLTRDLEKASSTARTINLLFAVRQITQRVISTLQ